MEKIKVPNSLDDMNLSHLPFYFALAKLTESKKTIDDLTLVEIGDLNALFFGLEFDYFDKYTPQSNIELLSNIILACSKRKQQDIRPVIEIGEKKYIWQSDYSKHPVSFFRDVQRCNFEDTPADILAFCYVEQGMYYNQIDKVSKVIINDRHTRAKELTPHFTLAQYIDVIGFFLESYPVLRLSYLHSQLLREQNRSRVK